MKYVFTFIIGIVVLLLQTAIAQGLSNKGKEFWVGYGHHQFFEQGGGNTQQMVLYLSAEQPATVVVSINGTSWTRTYNIPANTVIATDYMPKAGTDDSRLYSLPPTFGGTNSEGVFNKGIHITSNVPIVAYAHIFGSASSGATMLLPTETWGYSYIALNYRQLFDSNCFSWINVISNHNNTVVTITPSVPSRNGRPANVPFTITLNKGEVYQLLGALAAPGSAAGYDLTGTTVKSIANSIGECYPIATISGSSRTRMEIGCGNVIGGGDNYIQQVFPSQAWGKRYLTAPTSASNLASTRMPNYYRIVVKDPTTVVRLNGVQVPLSALYPNNFYEYVSDSADYITADKPIMVAQYMPSSPCNGSPLGDPEMFYISPIEQSIKSTGFYRNNRESININYLTLIIPTAGVSSLLIDGSNTYDYSYPHHNRPGYTVVVKRWNAAQAQCLVSSDSSFTAITYGEGNVESYGYNAGTLVNNLNALGEIRNELNTATSTNPYTCKGTPFIPTILLAYKPTLMVWKMSQLSNISPNADVTIANPVLVDSIRLNDTWYFRYRLSQSYQFNDTGAYIIPILCTHPIIENCNNTEEVKLTVTVRTSPVASFNYSNTIGNASYTGCLLDTVYFSGSLTAAGGSSSINRFKWNFSNSGADTSNLQNPAKRYATAGTYAVRLRGITEEGCIGDTTRTITIYPPPTAGFTTSLVTACEPASIQFTDTSSYAGSAPQLPDYWNFGNGQTATHDTTISYPVYGMYTVRHVNKISALCISDTAIQVVRIYAKPRVGFTYPQGCLQPNGTAQFTNTTLVPDSQAVSYLWNFGDSTNATPANSNTSTVQNPSHQYITFGNYTIRLRVTTANGCSSDTSINVTFSLSPVFTFAPINSVCINGGAISVANASITNNVPGTGHYRGPGTDSAGNFNPIIAGVGTHTIWYIFQTTGGCRDSVSQTITVKPVPVASFTYPVGCLGPNGLAQFNSTSNDAGAGTLSYAWNFGDSALSTVSNPNTATQQSPSHLYTQYGIYTVRLTINAANGCSKDTSVTTAFYLRPVLSYLRITSICANNGPISIATAAVTNGVPGSGKYRGAGTDTTGNFNPAIAGAGVHTIWYVYQTPGSCNDSISQTIRVFPKPTATFSLSQTYICADSSIAVTVQSAVATGSLQSWNWNFGNGTGVYQNGNAFNLNYAAGTYTIRHYVISDSSCVSDTVTRTVVINPLPVANFTLPASICMPAGRAQFTNTSTVPGGGVLNYTWNFGDLTAPVSTINPLHTYGATGPYNVTLWATTALGCKKDTTKSLVTFYDQPVANFGINPSMLCQGTPNFFSDSSRATGSSISQWEWNFGDNSRSTLRSPVKRYAQPGNYTVSLVVKSVQGCVSDTIYKIANVYVQPRIDAGPSFIVPEGTLVRFAALANDTTVQFQWTPAAQLSNANVLTPTLIARSNQTYALTATGDGNCTATDTLIVKILRPLNIPNVFSPNGDGINDTWVIPNLADYPGATVEVYDRYGKLMTRYTGYARPWDGTLNSKPLPIGTYYYIIDLKNGFSAMNGPVTILR